MRSAAHLEWVRSLKCTVPNCRDIDRQAHHVRDAREAGTAIKPGDEWAVPLCYPHHHELHQHGRRSFERKYKVDLRAQAEWLALTSPIIGMEPGAEEFAE
jgi:hypothetical protein